MIFAFVVCSKGRTGNQGKRGDHWEQSFDKQFHNKFLFKRSARWARRGRFRASKIPQTAAG
jgi:hypothetical protein